LPERSGIDYPCAFGGWLADVLTGAKLSPDEQKFSSHLNQSADGERRSCSARCGGFLFLSPSPMCDPDD
jgi:hypothetical protein